MKKKYENFLLHISCHPEYELKIEDNKIIKKLQRNRFEPSFMAHCPPAASSRTQTALIVHRLHRCYDNVTQHSCWEHLSSAVYKQIPPILEQVFIHEAGLVQRQHSHDKEVYLPDLYLWVSPFMRAELMLTYSVLLYIDSYLQDICFHIIVSNRWKYIFVCPQCFLENFLLSKE